MSEVLFTQDVDVQLLKHSVSDQDVIHAAKVSTLGDQVLERFTVVDRDVTDVPKPNEARDRGFISYLMRDRHGSPFEHNSMTFFVRAPIFVAREFMRHRVGWSYNEESGRYRELKPEFYVPGPDRKLIQVGKPGAYRFEAGTPGQHSTTEHTLRHAYKAAWESYQLLLQDGVAREVARMVLPVGIFTAFYATCNARSLMHFLSLRTISENAKVPSFPQREIEMVAEKMETCWGAKMPITWEMFNEHGRVAP